MKKIVTSIFVVILSLCVFVGCSQSRKSTTEDIKVYSFCGENEQFTVTNGVVILNVEEEVFYGGNLNITNEEAFADIASFTTTFYTLKNEEECTIMSNSVVDQTGGSIHISGDLGRMSGKSIISGNKVDSVDELKNNLYFELSITDLNGKKNIYRMQLTVMEITDTK